MIRYRSIGKNEVISHSPSQVKSVLSVCMYVWLMISKNSDTYHSSDFQCRAFVRYSVSLSLSPSPSRSRPVSFSFRLFSSSTEAKIHTYIPLSSRVTSRSFGLASGGTKKRKKGVVFLFHILNRYLIVEEDELVVDADVGCSLDSWGSVVFESGCISVRFRQEE